MITIVEKPESRPQSVDYASGDVQTVELLYTAYGSTDELLVRLAAGAMLPAAYEGLRIGTFELRKQPDTHDVWDISAQYNIPAQTESPSNGAPVSFTFSTTGGTATIKQSLETMLKRNCINPNEAVPESHGAINVGEDGPEGVEIFKPQFEFGYTFKTWTAAFDTATIYQLTGKVNSIPWKVFQAGEVLFLGAEGSGDIGATGTITFRFSAQPNEYLIRVGNSSTFSKDGWDYLQVKFLKKTEGANVVTVPQFAYVERVYEREDFHALGV